MERVTRTLNAPAPSVEVIEIGDVPTAAPQSAVKPAARAARTFFDLSGAR
jgi:hypothetical protein